MIVDRGIFKIISLFKTLFNIIIIIVPVLMVIMIMLDLIKYITSSDLDKRKLDFIPKRLISGALIFFVPLIVRTVFSVIGISFNPYVDCFLGTAECTVATNSSHTNIDTNINTITRPVISNTQLPNLEESGSTSDETSNTEITCSDLSKNACSSNSACEWVDMSLYGPQFNNLQTNNYYCAIK